MAIVLVCQGCQAKYSVSDRLRGKKAQCRRCGAVVEIGDDDVPVLTSDLEDLSADPLTDGPTGARPAPQALARQARQPLVSRPPAMGTAVAVALLALLLGGLTTLFLWLSGNPTWATRTLVLGIVAIVPGCALAIFGLPRASWAIFGVYGLVCLLGMTKAGASTVWILARNVNVPRTLPAVREIPPPYPIEWPQGNALPPSSTQQPYFPAAGAAIDTAPHVPPKETETRPRRIYENIELEDWQVTSDPLPEHLRVGPGREMDIVVQDYSRPTLLVPAGYGCVFATTTSRGAEIWNMQQRRKQALLPVRNIAALSSDGHFVCTESHEQNRRLLRVLLTDTGEELCTVDPHSGRAVSSTWHVAFAGDKLITITRGDAVETGQPPDSRSHELRIWNPTSGALLHVMLIDVGRYHFYRQLVFTPGGRYLVTWDEEVIFWDLAHGTKAGVIHLPDRARCLGVSFPPNGDRIAVYLRKPLGEHGFEVLDMTGERQLSLKYASDRESPFDSGLEPFQLGWLESDRGWLMKDLLVDRRTGNATHRFALALDRSRGHVLLDADQLLSVEPCGKGYWNISLRTLVADDLPQRDLDDDSRSYRPEELRLTFPADRQAGAYQNMHVHLLTTDPEKWQEHWKWCPLLQRPAVGLRWGIGVLVDLRGDAARRELQPELLTSSSYDWLEKEAGVIAGHSVMMLRSRTAEGRFGNFAGAPHPLARELFVLGGGTRTQLNVSARKAGVDLALIIELQRVLRGTQQDVQMTLHMADVASGNAVWTSRSATLQETAAARDDARDLLGELVRDLDQFLTEKLAFEPLAKMPKATIAARVEAPTALHKASLHAALAELLLYQQTNAITKEAAETAYQKLLGSTEDAAALAGDDPAAKKRVLERRLRSL